MDQRDNLRLRTVQGLSWLEAEVRELVDIANFRTEADRRLFEVQFERVRRRIDEFEKDLIDLLICYPETRDTAPLRRLLQDRTDRKAEPPDPRSACNPPR